MNQRLSRKRKRALQSGYRPSPPQPRPKTLPQPNVFFVALISLVGSAGVLCVLGVGLILHDIWRVSAREALVRALPDVTRAAPGETAILDGRIAAFEPAQYKEFVAYVRERQRGGGGRGPVWVEIVDQAKPAFAVQAGSRLYRIESRTYVFDRVLPNWTDAKRTDEGPSTWRSAITIQGLVTNSPVMAVGTLVPAAEGVLSFRAESIAGLSRADYVDRIGASKAINWRLAAVLTLLAPILIYLSWRGIRRVMGW